MNPAKIDGVAAAAWLRLAGLRLEPEEAVLFLEAATALEPWLEPWAAIATGAPPGEVQQIALRGLWLRTGAPAAAPHPMPLHPLSPGMIGASWRWLREALSRSPRAQAE